MATTQDRIELTSATLFEALQGLAGEIKGDMARIDRTGGTPTEAGLAQLRNKVMEFQALMAVLDRALSQTREGGAFVREIVGGIAKNILTRSLGYEAAHVARLEQEPSVPLFGAVTFARDLAQLDRLAEQVPTRPAELDAQVIAARNTLQGLIKRCPQIADFG
ncbi:MAG: hypothetical protein FJX54_10810 [Alphaproteobacteria bacterium]|nr:hypothetical protein [Alphaproteobacteria bacterium]